MWITPVSKLIGKTISCLGLSYVQDKLELAFKDDSFNKHDNENLPFSPILVQLKFVFVRTFLIKIILTFLDEL